MDFKLELIGFTLESCRQAQALGAHRIELCDNPGEGGTTPSYGFIQSARRIFDGELYPIIRPRGGDFLYTTDEWRTMQSDVEICKQLGCDGVVIGMLHADGTVDKERCARLVELAYPMGVTFHRAFDRTAEPFRALEDIISIGCERILTSGQRPNAMEGAPLIAELIQKAGDRIIIMPGSGVRADNIAVLAQQTSAVEFHTSARTNLDSSMTYQNEAMQEKMKSVALDEEEVRSIIATLQSI